MSNKAVTYKDAGVDIDGADRWTEEIGKLAKRTYGPGVLCGIGGFAGLFQLTLADNVFHLNYRNPVLVACTDGVGTKLLVAKQAKRFDTIGIDLVAMSVNDMIVVGAEPLFFLDYLAIGKLKPNREIELLKGISDGCRQAGCSLIGGETAEMPGLYNANDFDLSGFAVGIADRNKIIDGRAIEPGDIILGLESNGLHSNGYSLVRKIIFEKLKLKCDDILFRPNRSVADELLRPTRIYVSSILRILKRYKVKRVIRGMAHITGGGLVGNIPRVLPNNCKAIIHVDSWRIPEIFKLIQNKGPVRKKEMFKVFNMGIGMILIVRPAFADSIMAQLSNYGETVYKIGRITRGRREVELR